MRVYTLCKTTTTGAQTAVDLENQNGRDECLVSIEFAPTGTATLQGRIDNDGAWIDIAGPYTTDTLIPVAFVPNMRLSIAVNDGTITAKVAVA